MATDLDEEISAITRIEEQKQKSFFFLSTIALATTIGIFGIFGGFVYGDYYGRKHAQFDNNELRKHYAGQCYSYIDSTLKKSIKTALEKTSGKRDQLERLDDIKSMLINLQLDMEQISGGETRKARNKVKVKEGVPSKKKVASAN